MHVEPRCEHCAYDLSGIGVSGFIAHCPECGRDSDIRRAPRPHIPWWHTPAAIGVGILVTFAEFLACVLMERWGLISADAKSRSSSWAGFACVGTGATVVLVLLRNDYRAEWLHQYGRGNVPLREWGLLLVDWVLFCFAIVLLPGLVFMGLWIFLGI